MSDDKEPEARCDGDTEGRAFLIERVGPRSAAHYLVHQAKQFILGAQAIAKDWEHGEADPMFPEDMFVAKHLRCILDDIARIEEGSA